jgi:hypothetical protein
MTPFQPNNSLNNRLLTYLMEIYNINARQIESLQNSNELIREHIIELLLRNNNINNRQRNQQILPVVNTLLYPNNNNIQRENNINNNINNSILQSFFNPIPIVPTATQIENARRIAIFGNITRPINNACPITLDRFNDNETVSVIRYCNHIFNTDALNNWFRENCRCPVCRYDIRSYNLPNANANANANSISNLNYDSNTDSVTFDINADDLYNNITRIAINTLNNIRDASGNNIRDASGNNIRPPTG